MFLFDPIIKSLQNVGGISTYFDELMKFCTKNSIEHIVLPLAIKSSEKRHLLNRLQRSIERYSSCAVERHLALIDKATFLSSYYRLPSAPIPSAVTVHDFVYEKYMTGFSRLIHTRQKYSSIRAAKKIICISEATRADLIHYLPEVDRASIEVVHNGVSDFFAVQVPVVDREKVLIYVGARSGYKNFSMALNILLNLEGYKLIVVGASFTTSEKKLIFTLGLAQRIECISNSTHADLTELYNRARYCIYPSFYEGFGIPILESIRCGCIPIVGPTPALVEVGRDIAIVQHSYIVEEWVSSILLFDSQITRRLEFFDAAHLNSKKFSWARSCSETIEVMRGCLR